MDNVYTGRTRRARRSESLMGADVVDLECRLTFLFWDRIWKDKYNPKTKETT